jgi:hypothetical protein
MVYWKSNYKTFFSSSDVTVYVDPFFKERQNVPSFQEGVIKVEWEQRNEKHCIFLRAQLLQDCVHEVI